MPRACSTPVVDPEVSSEATVSVVDDSMTESVRDSESEETKTASLFAEADADSEVTLSDAGVCEKSSGLGVTSKVTESDVGRIGDVQEVEEERKPGASISFGGNDRSGLVRLTARQLARRERLASGIHQTQWNDLDLPQGLDYAAKAKSKDELTKEQQLKKLKEAEERRVKMQKLRTDNVETRKARIRASTSSKYCDGSEQPRTDGKTVREDATRQHDMIKIRRRVNGTSIFIPKGSKIEAALEAQQFEGYPPHWPKVNFDVDPDVAARHRIGVGSKIKAEMREPSKAWCFTLSGSKLGVASQEHPTTTGVMRVKSVRFDGPRKRIKSLLAERRGKL